MLKLTSVVVLLSSILIPSIAEAECPATVGTTISMESPRALFEKLNQPEMTKGEFETTEQYEARKSKVSQSPITGQFVERDFLEEGAEYDADKQRYVIREYVLGSAPALWNVGLGRVKRDDLDIGYSNHAVELSETSKAGDAYEASNAYGATVQVTTKHTETIAIFDKKKKRATNPNWESEFKIKSERGYKFGAIGIDVPIEEAKALKGNMRLAVFVTPKKPFTFTFDHVMGAKINRPRDLFMNFDVIVGDVSCAVITDKAGTVLKTIPVAY